MIHFISIFLYNTIPLEINHLVLFSMSFDHNLIAFIFSRFSIILSYALGPNILSGGFNCCSNIMFITASRHFSYGTFFSGR